jgi:hypothetical protein
MCGGNLFISEFTLDFIEFIYIGDQHFYYKNRLDNDGEVSLLMASIFVSGRSWR